MSLGDRLVPNPVWAKAVPSIRPISDRLRAHMFLAVAEFKGKHPHLYCYKSERWDAYLIPFFKHDSEASGASTPAESLKNHVATRYRSHATKTGKNLVSVKQNQEHPEEWWLYAFEFHNLILPVDFEFSTNHRWIDLERLSDPRFREAAVNGDVIRAIRSHFGTGLAKLERSPTRISGAYNVDP